MTNFEHILKTLTPEKLIEIQDEEYECSQCICRSLCDSHTEWSCDGTRVHWLNQRRNDMDLQQLLEEINVDDLDIEPGEKMQSYQRERLMFLAHDLAELDDWHKACDICYCTSYCRTHPHLSCRQVRYQYLSENIIDYDED